MDIDEAMDAVLGEDLLAGIQRSCGDLALSPREYLCSAAQWCLHHRPDFSTEPVSDPQVQAIAEARDLLMSELIQQGAYLAARLDGIELAARSLLNLELQTDKRDHATVFEAIHQAILDELQRRDFAL